MVKSGAPYEQLIAAIAAALDPQATVRVGQWLEGPDGEREVDVEVRGTRNGASYFALIECKDWKRPVDIQEIDKLESKRIDLEADETLLYSNSGFTSKALRKGERVGIAALSALASNDERVRVRVERMFYARSLSVDRWSVILYPGLEAEQSFPEPWDARTLHYQELPGGHFDHLKRRVVVPSQQFWQLGWLDREAWEEVDEEPEDLRRELEAGTFRFELTLLRPVEGRDHGRDPDFTPVLNAYEVKATRDGIPVDSAQPVELVPGAQAT